MGRKKKSQSFKEFRKKGNFELEADWSAADASIIRDLIVSVTEAGGALRFGYTRDRGAYSLGVHLGGEHDTQYVAVNEDINAKLLELQSDVDTFSSALASGGEHLQPVSTEQAPKS